MFREQQRLRPASTGGGGQRHEAAARRSSWQQQQHQRVPIFGLPNQSHQLDQLDLDDREEDELIRLGQDEEEEEGDWRRAAQMLTEHDERRLLSNRQPRSSDVLDMVAPINRRLQQANQRARRSVTPTTESPSRSSSQQQQQQVPSSRKLAQRMVFTSHKQLTSSSAGGKAKQKKQRGRRVDNKDDEEEDNERRKLQEDQDDNSSLSFAQSGCHSILSAWRIKAANRAARLAATSRASSSQQQPTHSGQHANSERPQSVLSQASSVGKKSAASTAYTARSSRLPAAQIARIPLGPKSAQHFVTNTRRRRRANELIMNTLEARRRALSLNRSNLASSLFGSESYLGGNPPVGVDDYQRLSMSPSPLANNQQLARQSPSPFTSAAGRPAALSDLGGGRQSPAMLAQRNKLLAAAARHQQPSQQVASRTKTGGSNLSANKKTLSHSSLGSASGRPPPLAKLDQNSSDLCSSNDSSSGRDDDDDEGDGDEDSDGSQFTQLVTSELTPSCLLLEQSVSTGGRQLARPRVQSPVVRPQVPPPRPPERTKRKQVETQLRSPQVQAQAQQQQQQVSTSEEDDKNGNKLRRGALKRDSIRRLRLNRQQRSRETGDEQQYGTTDKPQSRPVTPTNQSSSRYHDMRQREREREHEELASKHLRPLSKARKLDIENNPFLNRHHFRTLSTRSTDSKQSYASQQQQVASRRTPLASVMQSSNEDEPAAERQLRPTTFRRGASARAATGSHVPEDTDLQMPRVDMENVRQVERMLRNMKPNEVVKSGRRELSTGQQVATSRSSREPRPTGGARPVETERKSDENVFKTTTRLVRAEGARSSDDVKFDLTGNRQQRQLNERWRHERTVPMRLADGSVFSEQRFLSDRVERVVQSDRLTATTGRSISPPAEFSDTKPRTAPPVVERSVYSSQARQVSAPPPPSKFVPTPPPRPSDRYGDRPQVDENRFVAPPKPSRARSEERPRQPPVINPEQQQRLRQRPPVVPRASKPSTTASRSSEPPKQFALDQTAKVVRASLPQFERTADDEFRKRVDQLRQMARANLEASEQRQAQEARARRDKMKLVKPMSTNWSGPATAMATDRPKSPNANDEGPLTSKNLLTTSSPPPATRREVRATDLDDMLLADRYQRPLRRTPSPTAPLARPTTTTWRRSNSSLASLSGGGGAVARASQPGRPASPAFGLPKSQVGSERAISPPSSVLSVEPRGDHSSATPMRVVVREKAAPRLDFAKVEQRPPVQHVRPAATAPPPPMRATHRQQAAAQQQHQRQEASPSGPSPQRDQRLRRPEATSHSRSPEFGQAAASSNDDSAIASSVSSPSPLSSYVVSQPQRPAGLQQQVATAGQSNRAQPPVVVGAQPPSTTPMPAARPLLVATTTSSNGGALQSILRRQQLAAASSFPQPTSGRLTPTSPIGRGPTPPTFMQQQQAPLRHPQAQPETASQMRQMPPASQQQSLPARRVHFNDRTSIRSFESISSEDSNTTAIQQHQSSNLDDLRQQVGSPDSMGSGSTSRLSNDSPAFGGEFRRGGGAAIYAIRGDPELEQPTVGQQQQQQHPVTTVQPPRQFHQPMVAPQQPQQQFYPKQQQQPAQPPPASHQTRPMMIMQPRVQYGQPPPQARPTGGYNPTAAMHQPQVLAQLSPQHHQQQLSPLAGSIRMTAPPTIKTNPQVPSSSSYQMMSPTSGLMSPMAHQQLQSPYMSRPQHSPVVVMVAPQQQQQQQGHGSLSAGRPAHLVTEADEEDPDYALRLRQAATRRAFNYVQPQQISPRQQPPNASGNTGGGGGGGGGGSGQVGVPGSRRQRTDLVNFQTEV